MLLETFLVLLYRIFEKNSSIAKANSQNSCNRKPIKTAETENLLEETTSQNQVRIFQYTNKQRQLPDKKIDVMPRQNIETQCLCKKLENEDI